MRHATKYLIAIVLLGVAAEANEPKSKMRQLIDESVHWYQLFPSQGSETPMQSAVALYWDNNAPSGSTDGATVVWLAKGRPEAVAAIYPWQDKFVHEFDSLSRGMIVAKRDDQSVWNPTTPGLTFHRIDGAPNPASTKRARLRQMKLLTKQFRGKLLGWASDTSQHEELRRLPTPLYRYAIEKPGNVLDGALFGYVIGTDPELLLILEAFGEENEFHWQYAFVRRTSGGLEGRFRNKLVWNANKYPKKSDPALNHVEFNLPLDEALGTVEREAAP